MKLYSFTATVAQRLNMLALIFGLPVTGGLRVFLWEKMNESDEQVLTDSHKPLISSGTKILLQIWEMIESLLKFIMSMT